MKTIEEVNKARAEIARRIKDESPERYQLLLLIGMLNALVWVADGPDCHTMDRVVSGEPLGKAIDN